MDTRSNFLLNLFLLLALVGVVLLVAPFWRHSHSSSFHVSRFGLPALLILIGGIGIRRAWMRLGQR
jgi:hypothetical protein